MRKLALAVLMLLLCGGLVGQQAEFKQYQFLPTAISVNDSITAVHGTAFTSNAIPIPLNVLYGVSSIEVTFTPASGAAFSLDFEFQVSQDSGTTWSHYSSEIQVDTNTAAVTGSIVRFTELVYTHGITNIRLYRVVNNSGAGNCTLVQVKIGFWRAR